ncbi:Acetyltransferase [Vibrio chagasii]|nr:Acetyltransferase [Vibrio chagasii]CAH7167429.1 Acetyltransferase [Vibrio chagasii]CAH7358559.1 Acetyltransferase [Vibrio chagasii]
MSKLIRVLKEELWSLFQWVFLFIPGRVGHYSRGFFLGIFIKGSKKRLMIKENVEIYHPERLTVGNFSGIGRNNILDAFGEISIGNNVRIGPNVMLATMAHAKVGKAIGTSSKTTKPIIIGNNVWIGHGVTILPGVTIGDNVTIAAGAVVTKSFSSDKTIAGVPAKEL